MAGLKFLADGAGEGACCIKGQLPPDLPRIGACPLPVFAVPVPALKLRLITICPEDVRKAALS